MAFNEFWSEYQSEAWTFAKESSKDLEEYLLPGLVGEVGELHEKIKRVRRGDYEHGQFSGFTESVVLELGDCLWYPFAIASLLGMDVSTYTNFKAPSPLDFLNDNVSVAVRGLRLHREAARIVDFFMTKDGYVMNIPGFAFVASSGAALVEHLNAYLLQAAQLADALGFTIEYVAAANLTKLRGRKACGTIGGIGDVR